LKTLKLLLFQIFFIFFVIWRGINMGLKLPKFYSFFGSKKFRWKKNCGKELAKKLLSSSCTFQKSFLAPPLLFLVYSCSCNYFSESQYGKLSSFQDLPLYTSLPAKFMTVFQNFFFFASILWLYLTYFSFCWVFT